MSIFLKIVLLGFTYGSLLWLLLLLFNKVSKNSMLDARIKKTYSWVICILISVLVLFVYSQSYWGSHGSPDHEILPIGHAKKIERLNFTETILSTENKYSWVLSSFTFTQTHLFAKGHQQDKKSQSVYLALDLKTDEIKTFYDKVRYLSFSRPNGFPEPETFEKFEAHYNRHWNGWRFWLLP